MEALPLTWWVYFPDEARARAAAIDLDADDYLVVVDVAGADAGGVAEPGAEWLLRAAKPLPSGVYEQELRRVLALAHRHGGQFDGWETGVVDISEALIELKLDHLLDEIE